MHVEEERLRGFWRILKTIGRGGQHTWPTRSPDLMQLDFFVWGLDEESRIQKKVSTQEELLDCIADAAAQIKNNHPALQRAIQSIRKQAAKCVEV
ncbi:hypothetical protein J6590_068216 [Homalodisca vitripennis]|nr:hypothetical protein J6590_068216 [Homalodisca vitripennis]